MMRTTVFAAGFLSAASLEFVSQTWSANLTMSYTPAGPPTPTIATVEVGVDMELVKMRMNEYIQIDMPKYNITSTTKVSMIADAAAKRYTMYTDSHTVSPQPMPQTPATCQFFEFPSMPAPAVVAKCLQDVAALAKPVASEGGLQKYKMNMPVPKAQGAAEESIYTDKDFIVKKVIVDVSVTGAHPMTIHEEMVDMISKAGVPDSSEFVVPAKWGTCKKQAVPPMPASNNPVLMSFMHCMGMGASQETVVV